MNRFGSGLVRPILYLEGGDYGIASPETFPSDGTIFVRHGYDEIEARFEIDEAFFVEAEINPEPRGEADWMTTGSSASPASVPGLFCPIFQNDSEPGSSVTVSSRIRPFSPTAFIQNSNGTIFGPFYVSRSVRGLDGQYESDLLPKNVPPFALQPDTVFSFDFELVPNDALIELDEISAVGERLMLISNTEQLRPVLGGFEELDWIDDEQLVRWADKVLANAGEENFTRRERSRVISSLGTVDGIPEHRFNRLQDLFTRMDAWEENKSSILEQLIKTQSPAAEKAVAEFVEANPEWVFQNTPQVAEISGDLDNLEQERLELELEVARLRKSKDEIDRDVRAQALSAEAKAEIERFEKDRKEAEAKLATASEQLATVLSNISTKETELGELAEVGKLSETRVYLERRNHELSDEMKALETTITELKLKYEQSSSDLIKQMATVLPFVEVLSTGRRHDQATEYTKFNVDVDSKILSSREILDQVDGYFRSVNRPIDEQTSITYLIAIAQNFFTLFAGYPGVGKTTFVRHLVNALHIEERFLPISVGRGWASEKDLIGYYNPLSNRFEAAPTGLFDFLKSLDEAENGNSLEATSIVLLDEANLSPIEHYWSSFFAHENVNDEARELTIRGGQGLDSLPIQRSTRFIGTINNDRTTESLSNRFLDRTPIFSIDPPKDLDEEESVPDVELQPVSHQSFLHAFGTVDPSSDLTADERTLLSRVFDCLSDTDPKFGSPTIVSPRKRLAVQSFIKKSREFEDVMERMLALDGAVSAFVLPMINGSGEAYRERLKKLLNVSSSLTQTSRKIHAILEAGKARYDNFEYFY